MESPVAGETAASLRICTFGTYEQDYSRTQYLTQGLQRNGVEIVEVHRALWGGTADKIAKASGGWKQAGFLFDLVRTHLGLMADYAGLGPHDAVLVPYAGLLDILPAWLLTRISRRPLVLDALLSVYNSVVNERKLTGPNTLKAKAVHTLEKMGCRLADRALLDTEAHIDYFCELYGLDRAQFVCIPISAQDRFFHPPAGGPKPATAEGPFRVVYHGKYVPNAGVDVIIQAAALLADDEDILFEFIGEGEGKADAQRLVESLGIENAQFTGWLEKPDLVQRLYEADLCLGAFGDTPQARRAMSNKVLEALAVGVPVITADTASNREVVRHDETAYLCPVGDPEALAGGIRTLKADPALRTRLSAAGLVLFREQFSPEAVGLRLKELLESLVRP